MKKSKMRFDEAYDPALSGGYRDVQIAVRIDTEWTRKLSLDKLLLEVQLHQLAFFRQKVSGGGHKGYVLRRNMLAM